MSKVAFSDDTKMDDEDDLTNRMLLRDKKTFSRARLQRMRIMSAITGNDTSRKKVFSEIQEHADYKTYEILVHGTTIHCAKVFNPALLGKNSKTWSALENIQRFELEDPEGILTTIPKHYAANMQHLESFSITWTRVKSLPSELFSEALKTLSLQRNLIKTLNGIERAVNLSNLDVSSNLLTELPKTFGQLQNLTTLNISGNGISELPANFGSLNQLRLLDCSCNRLSFLPDSIENLLELIIFDVCNNRLTEFPENIGNMPKLEDLRARGNQLHSLPKRFDRLNRLGSLTLRKNKLEEVPSQLSNISSLQNLNLRENSISSFPKAIPSLKSLILDSNQLDEIGVEMLKCGNVQMLSLENNQIKSIPTEIKRLRHLRVLHLSGNPIETVPETIDQLANLRHLSLKKTRIRTLPMAFIKMDSLAQLDIDDCPDLTDPYLWKELRENGISGLKSHMSKNQSEPDEPIIHLNRKTLIPSTGTANEEDGRSDSSELLVQPNRKTIFASLSNSVKQHFRQTQQTSDLMNLSSIKESKPKDDFTPGGPAEYGTVDKSRCKGKNQKLPPDGDEAEMLTMMDSGVLIRQRLDEQNTELNAAKRQSHV